MHPAVVVDSFARLDSAPLPRVVAGVLARFILLLAVTAGLAVGSGPARDLHHLAKNCACCPIGEAMPCCTASHTPPPNDAAAVPPATDFKLAAAPILHVLGVSPQLAVEPPSALRRIAARQPARPRLALLCMRLI